MGWILVGRVDGGVKNWVISCMYSTVEIRKKI